MKKLLVSLVLIATVLMTTLLLGGCQLFSPPTAIDTKVYDEILPLDPEAVAVTEDTGISYVSNQLIVSFEGDASQSKAAAVIAAVGGEIVGGIGDLNIYQVAFKATISIEDLKDLMADLDKSSIVESVTLNRIYDTASDSNPFDPWAENYREGDLVYNTTADGSNWGLEAIHAPRAWQYNSQMSTVKIGVVDGGFYINSPELDIKKSHATGVNGSYLLSGSEYTEDHGEVWNQHGTFVTGIIGAVPDNGIGVAGVVKDRNLYVYRVDGQMISNMAGIYWCIDKGVRIVNLSMGEDLSDEQIALIKAGNLDYATNDEFLNDQTCWTKFLKKLKANPDTADFLIVQAAGNDGIDAHWNGNLCSIDDTALQDCFLIVGGCALTDQAGIYERYANDDGSSNIGENVDVVAPGEDIYGLWQGGVSYETMSGTSAAAPFVTGTAALVSAIDSDLSCAEIRAIILETTGPAFQYDGISYDLIDAGAAVELAIRRSGGTTIETTAPAETTAPSLPSGGLSADLQYIAKLLQMNRSQIIDELGSGFENIGAGGEGWMDGYSYADSGLTIAFYPEGMEADPGNGINEEDLEMVQFIYADVSTDINGAQIGMTPNQIKAFLGEPTTVYEGSEEFPASIYIYSIGELQAEFVMFSEAANDNFPTDYAIIEFR